MTHNGQRSLRERAAGVLSVALAAESYRDIHMAGLAKTPPSTNMRNAHEKKERLYMGMHIWPAARMWHDV